MKCESHTSVERQKASQKKPRDTWRNGLCDVDFGLTSEANVSRVVLVSRGEVEVSGAVPQLVGRSDNPNIRVFRDWE